METNTISKYTGDQDLIDRISSNYKNASDYYKPWENEAKEDHRFALGDQWEKDDRDALKEQGRPCLTFNRIRPVINVVTGYERENVSRVKISPEGGEDKVFSEVMDRGLKYIDKTAKLPYHQGYWFDESCHVGKSFLEASISYNRDPIRGELKFTLISPYRFLPDPSFKGYDLNDGCAWGIKVERFTKDQLIKLFPEKKKIIDGFKLDTDDAAENIDIEQMEDGVTDDYGNTSSTLSNGRTVSGGEDKRGPAGNEESDEKFTLKEMWYVKEVKKYFVIESETGEPRKFDDKESADTFAAEQGEGIKVIERTVPEMWVADMCCGFILQDIRSPFEPYYSGYPVFRILADWSPNAESEVLRCQSLVRPLKDPQREKNKSKSQNLHILNTQANSGWVGYEQDLTPAGWQALEKMGSKPGIVVKTQSKDSNLREILPKGPNAGQLQREQKADEEFVRISGIDPTLWGNTPQDLSGRAMAMRIKQGLKALARIFANYQYSKEIMANFILAIFPMLFDGKKLAKIVGAKYMRETKNESYPDGLSEGTMLAFLKMIQDNKYDLNVAEADSQSSIRYEIFQSLIEAAKAGVPIPGSLIVDYMDISNSEEVKQQIAAQEQAQLAAQQGQRR